MENLQSSYFHLDIHNACHCGHFERKKATDAINLKVRLFLQGLEGRKWQRLENSSMSTLASSCKAQTTQTSKNWGGSSIGSPSLRYNLFPESAVQSRLLVKCFCLYHSRVATHASICAASFSSSASGAMTRLANQTERLLLCRNSAAAFL
jgi:hypothetical protein